MDIANTIADLRSLFDRIPDCPPKEDLSQVVGRLEEFSDAYSKLPDDQRPGYEVTDGICSACGAEPRDSCKTCGAAVAEPVVCDIDLFDLRDRIDDIVRACDGCGPKLSEAIIRLDRMVPGNVHRGTPVVNKADLPHARRVNVVDVQEGDALIIETDKPIHDDARARFEQAFESQMPENVKVLVIPSSARLAGAIRKRQ